MMNNKISFLNVVSVKNNLIEYKCPSCGSLCNEKTKKCDICGYNLKEYKDIIFSKYLYFNNTIDLINKKDYFNALLEISKFLAFLPDDEKGNELYIFLLYKNNRKKEYSYQLEQFENKFKYSSFIIFVEENGIDKYKLPKKMDLDICFLSDSFNRIVDMYNVSRYRFINDILDLENGLFDLVCYDKGKNNFKNIENFYNKRFLQFLSKYEISVESNNGKNYYDLSDDEKKKLEVIGESEAKKKTGTIITISPAIYIRSKLLSKEKVLIVKKNKRW